MKNLEHENIIKCYDAGIIKKGIVKGHYYIVMEHAEKSLREILDNAKESSEINVNDIAKQLARGLSFLHSKKNKYRIIHRDLKPQNILFKNGKLKISDFGLAAPMNKDKTFMATSLFGTKEYMPPEYTYDSKISTYTDIFSYGIVLLECLIGSKEAMNVSKQISCKNSDWMEFEKKIDEKWFLLISNCLNPNYRKRPGISEIISYLNGDNKVINRIGNATQVMKQGLHEERERSEKTRKKSVRKTILLTSLSLIVLLTILVLFIPSVKNALIKVDPNINFNDETFRENSPVLKSPGEVLEKGFTTDETTPVFKWKRYKGTEYYKFAIYKEPYEGKDLVLIRDHIYDLSYKIDEGILQPETTYCWILRGVNITHSSFSKYSEPVYFTVNDNGFKDIIVKSAEIIDYDPYNAVNAVINEKIALNVTLQNTGNVDSLFIVGGSIWDINGENVVNFEDSTQTVVRANKTHKSSWSFIPDKEGQYWIQYAVWLDEETLIKRSPSPSQRLIVVNETKDIKIPFLPVQSDPGINQRPGEKINTLTPTLKWSKSEKATHYEIGISKLTDKGFKLLLGEYVNENFFKVPEGLMEWGVEYRWNVQAINDSGGSGYTNKYYIKTEIID
jgi:serine/threonine protein kinase